MKLTTFAAVIAATVIASVASVACTQPSALGAGAGADSASKDGTTDSSGGSSGGEGDGHQPQTTDKNGLPCGVDKVLKAQCQTCHGATPVSGASTSLVTYDDLMKPAPAAYPGKKVWEAVQDRIHNDARPMPAAPATRVAGDDLKAMDDWFSAGTPKSSDTCTSAAPADSVKPLSCKPDTVLKAPTPFTMPADAGLDTYMCFGADQTITKKRHVIGLAPNVDNKKIVHHILLFQTDTAESSTPFKCEAFGSAGWRLVAGWAPGGNNLELPKEAGFPEEAGTTHWVLQIHYNNASNATGAQDNSGYSLCTTEDLRPNDAGVMAFGSTNFSLPPRSKTTVQCDYTLDDKFNGVKIFNASPHMHKQGTAMSTARLAGGQGDEQMVFEQKNFSFEAQSNYPIDQQLNSGDVMRTRCTYNNPGDQTIGFGENTEDEMCFDFMGYYPAIPDKTILGLPIFTWVTPSLRADCQTNPAQ
jgi:hypothetical protein